MHTRPDSQEKQYRHLGVSADRESPYEYLIWEVYVPRNPCLGWGDRDCPSTIGLRGSIGTKSGLTNEYSGEIDEDVGTVSSGRGNATRPKSGYWEPYVRDITDDQHVS